MRGKFFRISASCLLAGVLAPVSARAQDNFVGEFVGDTLSVEIINGKGDYVGDIQKGTEHFPLKAHEESGKLVGSFSTTDGEFKFSAALEGNSLTLVSGGKIFILKKHVAAENPVHAIAADKSAKADVKDAGELAGYTVVNSTDAGKAFEASKPDAKTIVAAFQATFPDLAKYFDQRPVIVGVFEDTKNHRSGGASFTAKLHGQAMNGFVSCKLGEKGATVAVIFCLADAPKEAWAKLTAKPAGPASPFADVKLREYQFPDGTGTVGVAEGWQTNSPSLMTGVNIKGPAGQQVNLALGGSASTPDSLMVQMHEQAVMNARQWGFPPPPPLPVTAMIAAYTDPETAFKALCPQLSRMSQAGGGPPFAIEKIISVQKVETTLPGGQAALITFDLNQTVNGVVEKYRSGMRWDMAPVGPGQWMFTLSQVIAPVDVYDRDLPTMLAIALSLKENPQVIMIKTQTNIEAANARFAALQKANHELQQAFEEQNRHWEHNQLIQSRSFADFDETIIGYRTVEDTSTGYRRSVDLGNVHDIVDHLNRIEPGRFKEIPLRDEMYPLNGR